MALPTFKNVNADFSGLSGMADTAGSFYQSFLKGGKEWQEARQKEKEARLFSEMLAGRLAAPEAMQQAQQGPVRGNLEHFYELMKGQGSVEGQQAQAQAAQARAALLQNQAEAYPVESQARINSLRAKIQGQNIENQYAPDIIQSDLETAETNRQRQRDLTRLENEQANIQRAQEERLRNQFNEEVNQRELEQLTEQQKRIHNQKVANIDNTLLTLGNEVSSEVLFSNVREWLNDPERTPEDRLAFSQTEFAKNLSNAQKQALQLELETKTEQRLETQKREDLASGALGPTPGTTQEGVYVPTGEGIPANEVTPAAISSYEKENNVNLVLTPNNEWEPLSSKDIPSNNNEILNDLEKSGLIEELRLGTTIKKQWPFGSKEKPGATRNLDNMSEKDKEIFDNLRTAYQFLHPETIYSNIKAAIGRQKLLGKKLDKQDLNRVLEVITERARQMKLSPTETRPDGA